MKVKIVEQRDDVKEMTIEELAESPLRIGLYSRPHNNKFLLTCVQLKSTSPPIWCYASATRGGMNRSSYSAEAPFVDFITDIVRRGDIEIFAFDTDRELYLWMAE